MRGTVSFRRPAVSRTAKTARRERASWLALGLTLCAATGCASTSHADLMAFLRAHQHTVATGHYTVMPPDAILVHAPVAAEVDGVVATLRPDGKVALRLLGEVDVAGLTTDQIADKLHGLLARYYVDPEVVVDVARYASQCYYVFGQVASPGPKLFTGRDTLLNALAEARPTFLAWRARIHVVRPSGQEGQGKTIVVNLDEMVRTGNVTRLTWIASEPASSPSILATAS